MMAPSGRNSSFDCALNLIFDAGEAKQFERAQMKMRGARQRRTAAQPFDRQRRHAMLSEEHRGRQADQPAADDQNGKFAPIGCCPFAGVAHRDPPALSRYCRKLSAFSGGYRQTKAARMRQWLLAPFHRLTAEPAHAFSSTPVTIRDRDSRRKHVVNAHMRGVE